MKPGTKYSSTTDKAFYRFTAQSVTKRESHNLAIWTSTGPIACQNSYSSQSK